MRSMLRSCREAGDHLLGLLVVGGAEVEHVLQLRIPQQLGPGEGRDVGNAGGLGHRDRGPRRGRPDRPDQREDVVVDQLQRVGDRRLGFVGVVQGRELHLPAMDAAALVDLVEGGFDAEPHVPPQLLRGPAEGGGLPEDDALVGDTGHGRAVGGRRGRGQCGVGALGGRVRVIRSAGTGEGGDQHRDDGEGGDSSDPQLEQGRGARHDAHLIPPSGRRAWCGSCQRCARTGPGPSTCARGARPGRRHDAPPAAMTGRAAARRGADRTAVRHRSSRWSPAPPARSP